MSIAGDGAILPAKLYGFTPQLIRDITVAQRTEEKFQYAPSEVPVSFTGRLIKVLVPGESFERSVRKGETDAAKDTLYQYLCGGVRFALGFLAQAGFDIGAPETAMPAIGAARWQLIAIGP